MDSVAGFVQSGALIAAEALEPVDTATTVRVRNGRATMTDGPFAETKEQLAGFYLLDAPDLDAAPTSGFLYRELPGQFIYAIGLGNDELGYIVPPYNFVVDAVSPYYIEPYDHYEETNSLGDRMLPNLLSKITELWGGTVDLSERR